MKVGLWELRIVSVSAAGNRRLAKCGDSLCTQCLKPLGKDKGVRGMHTTTCARATYRAIQQGKVTEEELVRAGRMKERAKPGRKPSNPVTVAIEEGLV